MKKVYYKKLIRDKIPDKIISKGSKLETKKLNTKQFELELRKKVLEEASGIISAKTKSELISEIADTLDVITELQRVNKIKSSQIQQAQKTNLIKKGWFKKKIFLIWSSQDDYKSNEKK